MGGTRGLAVRTVVVALAVGLGSALAAPGQRVVYNPVTGRSEVERATDAAPGLASPPAAERAIATAANAGRVTPASLAAPVSWGDAACGDGLCGDSIGCSAIAPVCGPSGAYAGFEFTFVKPRWESNLAFTTTESDGAGNDTISDTPLDYDLVLSPRVFLGWRRPQGVGLRATWWQFDHGASPVATNPPANGFGLVDHPDFDGFGGVDLSSSVATDTLSVLSDIDAYALDIEVTHDRRFGAWEVGVGGGVRYASATQSYRAQLRDGANADALRGQIDYRQSIEGFGPTISLSAVRPLTHRAALFVKGRGSLLYGDGESRLAAGEDLDLTTSFTTNRTSSRDDLLSIAEVQLGLKWRGGPIGMGPYRPFLTAALEGQVWNGAGSATSSDGDLGFFGFVTAVGMDW